MSIVVSSHPLRAPGRPAAAPPAGPPLEAQRLSDRLAERIAAGIDGGDLKPGDRLPTEQQFATAYGVSRTVVREAVHQLKSRGLLRSRQGSGVFVAAPPAHQSLAFDPSVLESMDAVLQVIELRRVLEGEIAALAAERATRAQVQGLRRAVLAIEQAAGDGVAEDMAFHRAIGAATGNAQFTRLLAFLEQYLREAMRVTKANEARHADFMQQVRDEHHAIVDAVAAHDPAAARRAATAHIQRGEWRLRQAGLIDADTTPHRRTRRRA